MLEAELRFLDLESSIQYLPAQGINGREDWLRAKIEEALYTGQSEIQEVLGLLYL